MSFRPLEKKEKFRKLQNNPLGVKDDEQKPEVVIKEKEIIREVAQPVDFSGLISEIKKLNDNFEKIDRIDYDKIGKAFGENKPHITYSGGSSFASIRNARDQVINPAVIEKQTTNISLGDNVTTTTDAKAVKALNTGEQPDGDYVNLKADGQFFNTSTNLGATQLNGAITDSATTITVDSTTGFASSGTIGVDRELVTYTGKTATTFTGCTRGALGTTAAAHTDNTEIGESYVSSWYDTDGFGTLEFFFTSDVPSANKGILIQYSDDVNAATPDILAREFAEYKEAQVRIGFLDLHTRPKLDGFRLIYTNGAEDQTNIYISSTGRVRPEVGIENSGNAVITASFPREVALGNIPNYAQNTKFGRNDDVDTAQAADLWNGGRAGLGVYDYTGFNATANENITTVSDNAADVGTLVSSGTITTTAKNKVIDSTATFSSDGVVAGDVVLNDSRGTYGYVTSVDSETQLTVFQMQDTEIGDYDNVIGNTYRVATSGGTGAAVVMWSRILDENYRKQKNIFVILNGTTGVTTTANVMRLSKGRILLAGSGGTNTGEVKVNQATSTTNVFAVMPSGSNQTLIAADTVPKDQVFLIETISAALSISGGAASSAVVSLRTRPKGGVFTTERVYDLTSGGGVYTDEEIGGILLQGGTDFKLRANSVSANNSRVSGRIEYLEIDEV